MCQVEARENKTRHALDILGVASPTLLGVETRTGVRAADTAVVPD
jgi:hypothetical protein